MRLSRILCLTLICSAMVVSAAAQYSSQDSTPDSRVTKPPAGRVASPDNDSNDAPPDQAPAVARQGAPSTSAREWVPQGIEALGQTASSRTEFTFDHSMLVLASKIDQDNEDLRRVIAGVNGVSVHTFRFPGTVSFDPMIMGEIAQQYREAGWQHLVSKHKENEGRLTTDLWVHMDHASIRDIAVLFVGTKQLNFVSVSGSITPLDLLRLSGHFGIPRMNSGEVVPDKDR